MNAIIIGYLVLGAWCAFRTVPWHKTFFAAHLKSSTLAARLLGSITVVVAVAIAWPLYAWIWWRRAACEKILEARRPPAVDQAVIERALRDL